MKHRILSIAIIICLIFTFTGCKSLENPAFGEDSVDVIGENSSKSDDVSKEDPAEQFEINPLTGLKTLDPKAVDYRPVAVMVNNVKAAWSVQTGLEYADIVYETYVEGGITRLMAVYKDISKVPQIGTIRSARYSYVELAEGHDAVYTHAGLDETYCKPYMYSLKTNHFDLNSSHSGYAYRVRNGKPYEHTLYTDGAKLFGGVKAHGLLNLKNSQKNWLDFKNETETYVPSDGVCKNLKVPFSSSYNSEFKFDEQSGMYKKFQGGAKHSDYKSGKQLEFKNILVLFSTISTFPDNLHVKTDLSKGTGYYVSQGGYQKINWSKGKAKDSFRITLEDGSELKPNPGTTWVCLTNKNEKSAVRMS